MDCEEYNNELRNFVPPWTRERIICPTVAISKPTNNGNNHMLSKKQSFALAIKRSSSGTLTTRKSCNFSLPVFTSGAVTDATVDSEYIYNITVTNVNNQIAVITANPLPGWLTWTDNGDNTATLTGTPHQANLGNNPVNIIATNPSSGVSNQEFVISVVTIPTLPVFTSVAVTDATVDSVYTYNIIVTDEDNQTAVITADPLPGWLTLTDNLNNSATLTGTPLTANIGNNPVKIIATDPSNGVTNQEFVISVVTIPTLPPSITTSPNAVRSEISSNGIDYVLFTFAVNDTTYPSTSLNGNLSIDFTGSSITTLHSEILLIAGGGAGANSNMTSYNNLNAGAGGGGGGGGAYGSIDFTSTFSSVDIVVGKGGSGVNGTLAYGNPGNKGDYSNLSLNGAVLLKTFGGGGGNYIASDYDNYSSSGGCTGGASGTKVGTLIPAHVIPIPSLTYSFAPLSHHGGASTYDDDNYIGGGGGGGGGTGFDGANATETAGGNGGDGYVWDITGTSYGGGGSGTGPFHNQNQANSGTGGTGGGGTGTLPYALTVNGTNGLGGGGCGGFKNYVSPGDGGSGICIIAFLKEDIV